MLRLLGGLARYKGISSFCLPTLYPLRTFPKYQKNQGPVGCLRHPLSSHAKNLSTPNHVSLTEVWSLPPRVRPGSGPPPPVSLPKTTADRAMFVFCTPVLTL
jgi:hypothetical protein